MGDALRTHVLRRCKDAGYDRVCAVTRCQQFDASGTVSHAEHVASGTDRGVRFHTAAGARVVQVVAGYRPEDVANAGHGVLVVYTLAELSLGAPPTGRESAANAVPFSLDQCEEAVRCALGELQL